MITNAKFKAYFSNRKDPLASFLFAILANKNVIRSTKPFYFNSEVQKSTLNQQLIPEPIS